MNTKPPQGFELMVNITWAHVGISRYMLLSASWFLWILIFVVLTNEGVENRGTEGEICCSANLLQKSSSWSNITPLRRPVLLQEGRWCNPCDELWNVSHSIKPSSVFSLLQISSLSLWSTEPKREDARLVDFRTVGGSNLWKWNSTGLSSNWRKKGFDRL